MSIAEIKTSFHIWERFAARQRVFAGNTLVSTPDSELTYQQVSKVTDQLATEFSKAGITSGDWVALSLPNTPVFLSAFLALCRLNATVVLTSTKYRRSEWTAVTKRLHPDHIIAHSRLLNLFADWDGADFSNQSSRTCSAHDLATLSFNSSPHEFQSERQSKLPEWHRQTVLVKLTSGSTGTPKAVGLSFENVVSESENIVQTLALSSGKRILTPSPITHSYAFDLGVLAALESGAELILQDGFIPRRTLSILKGGRIDVFLGVPSMYRVLVDARHAGVVDLSHVPYLLSCTAPLSVDLIREFHAEFRGIICQHYGSSESGAATNQIPARVLELPESVGRAMNGVTLSVRDAMGNLCPTGQQGEIVIESLAVGQGYLMGAPEQSATFEKDGYRTGDLGIMDQQGFLTVYGRLDDMINVGGLKVSPREVAEVLEQHPAVREAAACGVMDRAEGSVVFAAVTVHRETTERELTEHCISRLADHKVPRRIDIREDLPKTSTGKITLREEDFT